MQIRIPSPNFVDMMAITFIEDPGAEFAVDSPITVRENETVRILVNKLLSKIVLKIFLEQWVTPNWKNFFLPMLDPETHVLRLIQGFLSKT